LHCGQKELSNWCDHPEKYYYHCEDRIIKNKKRPTHTPIGRFSKIIYNLKSFLDRLELPEYLQGGVKEHSPKTNASHHIGKPAVLNFDIADFFPSIKPIYVYRLFNKRLGCSRDVSCILTCLVTLNGELPQGSPTSTVVANLIILPLAERLNKLAKKHSSDYTQFVDDGTISGPGYIERLRSLIDKIIQQAGFRASPKPHKRTTMYQSDEQVVTGVRVNKRIDVPSQKVEKIREELRQLDMKIKSGIEPSDSEIASVSGRIQFVATLNAKKAYRFRTRLMRILKRAS
jgi:RNA-directed DNA polymerase